MTQTAAEPSTRIALDTSVAVPLLHSGHQHHQAAIDALGTRLGVLAGHAAFETFSVLTRLPGDERVTPEDARTLITQGTGGIVALARSSEEALETLGRGGIAGGATYDGLVGLAALDHGLTLLTRDERALPTYAVLGVSVELVR